MKKNTATSPSPIKYEFVNVNKIITKKEIKGQIPADHKIPQIGEDKALLLIAVCPSYSLDFKELKVVTKPAPVSGHNLYSFNKLPSNAKVTLMIGIYEMLPPFAFMEGVSRIPPEKLLTLSQVKKNVEHQALKMENEYLEQEQSNIKIISERQRISGSERTDPPTYLLTSKIRGSQDFNTLNMQIRELYKGDETFAKAVDKCAGSARSRLYKGYDELSKFQTLYCKVSEDASAKNAYKIDEFIHKLNVEHLLDEMALIMVAAKHHPFDYFVHHVVSRGGNRDVVNMDNLINLTKKRCLGNEFAHKLLWLPVRFVEGKQKQNSPSAPETIIPRSDKVIPLAVKRSGSGDSDTSEESDEGDALKPCVHTKNEDAKSPSFELLKQVVNKGMLTSEKFIALVAISDLPQKERAILVNLFNINMKKKCPPVDHFLQIKKPNDFKKNTLSTSSPSSFFSSIPPKTIREKMLHLDKISKSYPSTKSRELSPMDRRKSF